MAGVNQMIGNKKKRKKKLLLLLRKSSYSSSGSGRAATKEAERHSQHHQNIMHLTCPCTPTQDILPKLLVQLQQYKNETNEGKERKRTDLVLHFHRSCVLFRLEHHDPPKQNLEAAATAHNSTNNLVSLPLDSRERNPMQQTHAKAIVVLCVSCIGFGFRSNPKTVAERRL
jgi:hypothetical protein